MFMHVGKSDGQGGSSRVGDFKMQMWREAPTHIPTQSDLLSLNDVFARSHEAAILFQVQIPPERTVTVIDSEVIWRSVPSRAIATYLDL
jgi:hypothetical protein